MAKTYSDMYSGERIKQNNEITKDTIKRKIRELRKEKKLTQEKFGEKAGFPLITIQSWESRKNDTVPDTASLIQLCNRFGVDMDYFTGKIDAHDWDTDFVMKYTGLSEKAVTILHKMNSEQPDALLILDLLLQTDQLDLDQTGRYSSLNGIYFLDSIFDYIHDRQHLDLIRGFYTGKSSAYKTDDRNKPLDFIVSDVMNEYKESADLNEFHITQDILTLIKEMYQRYEALRPLTALILDNAGITIEKT